jgi:hypothetical protein
VMDVNAQARSYQREYSQFFTTFMMTSDHEDSVILNTSRIHHSQIV